VANYHTLISSGLSRSRCVLEWTGWDPYEVSTLKRLACWPEYIVDVDNDLSGFGDVACEVYLLVRTTLIHKREEQEQEGTGMRRVLHVFKPAISSHFPLGS
jgi:hypothetical protein